MSHRDLSEYAASKLDPIVKPLLAKLFKDQPHDPLQYMIHYLQAVKIERDERGAQSDNEGDDENDKESEQVDVVSGSYSSAAAPSSSLFLSSSSSSSSTASSLPILAVTDVKGDSSPMPRSRSMRRAGISAEPMRPDDDKTPTRVIPKSEEDKQSIRTAVSSTFLFSTLSVENLQLVIDAMEKQTFACGQNIIKQGEDGNAFYVLAAGTCDCFVGSRRVKVYGAGETFGELALMYNVPRAATISVTSSSATVWAVDRLTFRKVLMNATASKRQVYESFLSGIPLLSSLDKYERASLADALVEATFHLNDLIIRESDTDDKFYMLEEGECVALKTLDGQLTEVMSYKRGGYFGELALITSQPRAASVKCVSPTCKVVSLDRASFNRLLGPCEEILKRNTELYKQVEARIAAGKKAAAAAVSSPPPK